MKILLVRPWVNKNITTVKNYLFGEPMGLECFSTLLKENGVEVLLVDFMVEAKAKIEPYLEAFKPDAVGITSQCTDVENVIEIAKAVKGQLKSTPVMVGGVQATCFPNAFFVPEVDYVFKSTTRENVKMLLEELKGKAPSRHLDGIYKKSLGYINEGTFCYNEYVIPDRSATEKYRKHYKYVGYQPCAIVQTAYGCRNRCTFCIRWKIEGGQLREVPIAEIVAQIAALDAPYVMICDNDFLVNATRLASFCDLLEAQGIKKEFICYGSVNSILEKPELMSRLRQVGLLAVIVGYEAFENKQLSIYNKASTLDDNEKATSILKENDIACWGSFILHPDWTKSDFKKLLNYLDYLKPELATFSPLVPHPLTPLYETYKDRLLYDATDYDKWNFGDVLIRPSQMSLRAYYWEVLKLSLKMNGNFYSIRYTLKAFPIANTLKMISGFKTLFSIYIKNLLTRR